MILTSDQYDKVALLRQQLLLSPAGRETLLTLLKGHGVCSDIDDVVEGFKENAYGPFVFLEGLRILANMGIWTAEMFPRLLEVMATLPMPKQSKET